MLIQELEKELDTTFEKVDAKKLIYVEWKRITQYATNNVGKIVGLKINRLGLKRLPKNIKDFQDLQFLNLYFNQIKDISDLSYLKELKILNIRDNQISNIFSLNKLNKLIILGLMGNKINDISVLSELTQITELYLGDNQVRDISVLSNLIKLTKLSLWNNQIKDISALSNLIKLTKLDLCNNQIKNIFPLSNLIKLTELYLGDNRIEDISSLSDLIQLIKLDLSGNSIREISFLKNLRQITLIDLRYNFIKRLPGYLCDFPKIDEINISLKHQVINNNTIALAVNNIKTPPLDVIKQGKSAIKDYFKQKKIAETEIKLILIGNSQAGKTSLIDFMQNKFDPDKKSTHGINIETFDWNGFMINVWDFGGQDYYHATHRLFLTNNAVYILVWEQNTNKTEKIETLLPVTYAKKSIKVLLQNYDYKHWLSLIRKYDNLGIINSKDKEHSRFSPVIMLQNKIDEDKKGNDIEEQYEDKELDYYHISRKNTFALSVKHNKYYKNKYVAFEHCLQEIIKNELANRQELAYYVSIRNAVRKKAKYKNIILFEDYTTLCEEATQNVLSQPITEEQIGLATERLHNNGILIYYANVSNSLKLKNHVFINPKYVTDMIYRILDKNVIGNKGKFSLKHVKKIFLKKQIEEHQETDKTIAKEEAKLFISLMQSPNFELIFGYKHEKDKTYYATQYLPEELEGNIKSIFEQHSENYYLAFVLKYERFFSQSIISRIIANYGFGATKHKGKGVFWKYGLSFTLNKESFWVYCKFEEKKIYLKAQKGKKSQNVYDIYTEILRISENDENIKVSFDGLDFTKVREITKRDFLLSDEILKSDLEELYKKLYDNLKNITTQQILNLEERITSQLNDKLKPEFESIKTFVKNQNEETTTIIINELIDWLDQAKQDLGKDTTFFKAIKQENKDQVKFKASVMIPIIPFLGIQAGLEYEKGLSEPTKQILKKADEFLKKAPSLDFSLQAYK